MLIAIYNWLMENGSNYNLIFWQIITWEIKMICHRFVSYLLTHLLQFMIWYFLWSWMTLDVSFVLQVCLSFSHISSWSNESKWSLLIMVFEFKTKEVLLLLMMVDWDLLSAKVYLLTYYNNFSDSYEDQNNKEEVVGIFLCFGEFFVDGSWLRKFLLQKVLVCSRLCFPKNTQFLSLNVSKLYPIWLIVSII